LFGDASETLDMGPSERGVECGSAHIGGAKSIRLDAPDASGDDRCPLFGIGPRSLK